MSQQPISVAIETSGRIGGLAVGRADELLEAVELAATQRHASELMPMLDRLAQRHDFQPRHIGVVYVSIGPGSFTGLRIGVTVAKMLARTIGCRVVAVPTLDVVARNAPPNENEVAVCLNAKSGRSFTGFYKRLDDGWERISEPALLAPPQIAEQGSEDFAILGDHLLPHDWPRGVRLLDKALSVPRAEVVWELGRAMAQRGDFADAAALAPLYVRLPEAEEVWRRKNAESER